ncbi:MAG: hypothetical protein IJ038_02860 [Clostridia bacterium]|nr:hypothetical protein [Clostridia bacterium]
MTIDKAIIEADELRGNMLGKRVKRNLLSELDGRIYYELFEPQSSEGFSGYGDETPGDTELLVPYPYDRLYVLYLDGEICRLSGDTVKYNNSRILFNEMYDAFTRWYHRNRKKEFPNIRFPMRRY